MKKTLMVLFMILMLVFTLFNANTVVAAVEDFNTYTEVDALGRISWNTNGSQVNLTSMFNGDHNVYLFKNMLVDYGLQTTDWSVKFEFYSPLSNHPNHAGAYLLGAGFSDTLGDVYACGLEHFCGLYISTSSPYNNRLLIGQSGATKKFGSVNLGEEQWYYAYFNRTGTDLVYSFYSDPGRTSLVETISYSGVSTEPFQYFYAAQSFDIPGDDQGLPPGRSWMQRNYELTVDGCLEPDAPTNGVVTYDPSTTTINLTWTKGNNANNTVIRYSNTAYPTSITDGTLWYNGTDTWYENSSINTAVYYYIRAWSESNWSNPNNYKVSDTYLQFDYGSLTINVYDENTSDPISDWSIFISDIDGTDTYEDVSASNPLVIPSTDIPFGNDTVLVFNATNYSQRVYYYDLVFGLTHDIDAYLPPSNRSELYLISINNEYNEPENDVKVSILRYINSTVGWKNVSITYTDGNGQFLVHLIPDTLYKVRLNKTGFITSLHDYLPSDSLFTKTFRIYFEEQEYMDEDIYHEIISFTTGITGSNLFIDFFCSDNGISSTNIVIYNISNTSGVKTAVHWDNRTDDNDFDFTYIIEDGMCYEISLSLIHSVYGTINDIRLVCDRDTITTSTRFDTLLDLNFKYMPFGWSNLFGFFILISTMFMFGQQHVGVSLLFTGGVLAFINSVIGLAFLTVSVPAVIICFGVAVLWSERGRNR